jgi:hypothetical protein
MSARERHDQLQPAIVAWFNPANPNAVLNAAQYPQVLDKNKVGYVPCIVEPLGGYVHILTYEVQDSLTREWRKCRAVYASYDSAQKQIERMGVVRNASIVGSLLHA